MDLTIAFQATFVSFVITALFMVALRPVAFALQLVDRPGGRKQHVGNIPLLGGVAMYLGILCGMAMYAPQGFIFAPYVAASTIMLLIGLIDDKFGLSPYVRLVAQISAASIVVFGAGLNAWPFEDPSVLQQLFSSVFTIVVIVATINAFNMLDGIDGLTAGIATVTVLLIILVNFYADSVRDAAFFFIIASASGAFLVFNWPSRFNRKFKSFMGDSGSTLLGITVAFAILYPTNSFSSNAQPIMYFWFLALPLIDLFHSVARRLLQGRSPLNGDRGHYHHVLLDLGLSPKGTLLVLLSLCIVMGLVGALSLDTGAEQNASSALYIALCLGVMVAFRFLRSIGRNNRSIAKSRH